MSQFGKNNGKNLVNDELTENEKRVLLELINNSSVPYEQLVTDLKISRRTVSRVFVSLVEKGYIERINWYKQKRILEDYQINNQTLELSTVDTKVLAIFSLV